MADIAMCDNQNCKRRKECYRAKATPSAWQSWAIFDDGCNGYGCDYFIQYVEHTKKAEKSKTF